MHSEKDNYLLVSEVNYFHQQIFRRNAPNTFVEAYLAVHLDRYDLFIADEHQKQTVRLIVERKLDALGIELWLRSKNKNHLLSSKLQLMFYIAECDALHPEFRFKATGHLQCFLRLGISGLYAGLRLVRGRIQKSLYGLV